MIKENMAKLCPYYSCVDDGNVNCFDHPVYIQTCTKTNQKTSLINCSRCKCGNIYRQLIEKEFKKIQNLSVETFANWLCNNLLQCKNCGLKYHNCKKQLAFNLSQPLSGCYGNKHYNELSTELFYEFLETQWLFNDSNNINKNFSKKLITIIEKEKNNES